MSDYNPVYDLTEVLVTQATRQGFTVRRTSRGQYLFRKGNLTIAVAPPETQAEWWNLLGLLREAGMEWPPPSRWERGDQPDR